MLVWIMLGAAVVALVVAWAVLGDGGESFTEGQDAFYVLTNEHVTRLYVIAAGVYISKTTDTPPGSPAQNDAYVLRTSPTGVWTGHAHQVAAYDGAGWIYWSMSVGYTFSILDEGTNHKRFTKINNASPPGYTELHDV